MKKYVLKRILSLIPIIIIVSVVVFTLVHMTPGDPAAVMLGEDATPEQIEEMRNILGLNDPLPIQYLRWVNNCLHGNFGTSTAASGAPVAEMVASHFKPTIYLALYSMVITVALALPLGILAARKRGTIVDNLISVLAMCGISVPSFLLGLALVVVFAVNLKIFPVSGYIDPAEGGWIACLKNLTLPAVALGFMHSAYMMRMTRASMLEVLNSDYIRMAKAKGVREFFLLFKHAFRNALVTVVTIVGQGFIRALGGAAVIETLFGIPGMGSLMVTSIGRRDYQVIQAITLLIALINVAVNLVIDLLYGFVDPRIRLSD